MKMIVWAVVLLVVALIGLLAWSSYPWSIGQHKIAASTASIETDDMMEVSETPSVIKVLTYNIGYLYGNGSEGPGYSHREIDYYKNALKNISSEIKSWDADIVFLQEIDFESSRSANLNQAEFIAKKAGYPYVAQAVSWKANYIPFPYWPLKNNFGKMNSGGAILSRYPLSQHQYVLLAKPLSQPWWYNLFYLHRYFQKVTVAVGNRSFKVVNLHLEAFDTLDRESQVKFLVDYIKSEKIDLVAGDFNMVPSSALKKSKFYNEDNYENDRSFDTMKDSGLAEVIPNEIYEKDESHFFTFPSWAPDRRLDYIWFRPDLKMMKAEVLPSASSDHLPLRASFQIDGPRFNPYSQ